MLLLSRVSDELSSRTPSERFRFPDVYKSQEEGSTPAVAFEHVSKRFGDAVAVDDANLDIDEGAFVTIIGSSGCGKTTLLKMVNALAMPDDGRVLVHGKDTSGVDPIELRRNIGYALSLIHI